ncbi:MAG: MFS transporter [Pseudomonadota bacterium]
MTHGIRSLFIVLLLWIAGLACAMQFAKISVPFADIQSLYPGYGPSLGWLLSVVSLVGALAGAVAGGLAGRFGLLRVLVGGLALGGVVSLAQASLPSFGWMLLSRIIEGMSHLAIVIAAPTLIVQASAPRYRGAAMALWSTFFGVAFALMAWFGPGFVARVGLEGLFVAHGLVMLALAALLAVLLRNLEVAIATPPPLRTVLRRAITAYGVPHLSTPAWGWLFYTLSFVSLLTLLPTLLPAVQRGWVTTAMPLVSIVVAMGLLPLALRRASAVTLTILGFALACGVLLLWPVLPLAVLSVMLFAALGLVQGGGFAAVPELNDRTEDQALAYGLMAQMGNVGNLTGTPILLAILTWGGEAALIASAATAFVGAILALFTLSRRM